MADILQFLSETPTDNPDQKPADLYAGEKSVVDFLAQPDALPKSIEKGLVTPPDQAANVIRLQAKTGLPQGVIERNLDYVEAESNKQGFNAEEFRKNSPMLADWLAKNPNHVALAKTDIEGMTAIEKAFIGLSDISGAFTAAIPRMSAGFWGNVGEGLDLAGLGKTALGKKSWEYSGRMQRWANALKESDIVYPAVQSGIESVGTTLATLPYAISGKAWATYAAIGLQTSGTSFQQGKEEGLSPLKNLAFGSLQGGFEAGTEAIGLHWFLKDLKAGSPFWKVLRNQILSENAGEQIATVTQDFDEWAFLPSNKNKTFSDYVDERPSAMLDTFIATAVGVGLQTGVMHTAYKAANREEMAKIAQRRSEFLQALGENLNGSTILTKSPESVKSYIEHLKKDGDIQNVYIPVEAWDKLFQMDSSSAIKDILGSTDQYAEAKAVNGDIIIPLETYAEKIAGTTFHDQLMPDITFHPGEMSARAAEEATKNQDKEVEAEAKSIEDSYKANDPVRKVYNDVLGQMLGMKATRQEAERVATLESQRQSARAARLGVDPWELWQERPKTIQRELPAVLRNKEVDIHLDPLLDQLRTGEIDSKELNDLNDYLTSIGVDTKMSNAEIRKAIKAHEAKSDLYQSAFHGSPYKFDKFTLDHIGKGEGAQAYGYGLYFAGNKEVAEYYREALAPPPIVKNWSFGSVRLVKNEEYQDYSPRDSSPLQQAKALLSEDLLIQENDIKTAFEKDGLESARKIMLDVADNRIDMAKEDQPDIIPHLKVLRSRIEKELKFDVDLDKGQLYEVDIPSDEDMLDWDKPLSEQSEKVKEVVVKLWGGKAAQHLTGKNIYFSLAMDISGDQQTTEAMQAASKRLLLLGISGIRYWDGKSRTPKEGHHNYVVFDDKSIEILNTFYQTEFNAPSGNTSVPPLTGAPMDALGMYSRTENVITLLKKANPSTVLHELGHSWLEELRMDAQREGAPQQLTDDWNTIKAWAKIEDTISVESHEQFARGIEAYVMEGKSPSVELQTVFSRFKDWLVRIYKQIKSLNVEVSPEVREVFDRMLATDEQIALAREIQGYAKPLLDEAGMTKVEYQAYQKINEKAKNEAEDATRAKVMGELLREQSAWWKKARAVMHEEVSAEVDAIPTYRALNWLRKGVFPDGTTIEGIEPLKLSKDALVSRYGAPFLASLPKPYIYQAEGGLHPDVAAEYLGFGTGEELVKALAEAKPRGELIDAETDQRMKAKYGDMMIDGSIADEADFQVNNDRQAEVFMYEMKVLKRRGSTRNISPKEVFQHIARSVIQDKKVGGLDPKYYEHAARKAGQDAEKALLGKDMKLGVARNLDLAFEAKQRQLLNLYLFKEAVLAKTGIDAAQDRFMDMFKKDEKLAKTRNMDMVNAARAISAQHGIGGTDQNAMAYLEQMREYDPETYEDMRMVVDLATSDSKPFKQLTVAEFGLVQDSIDGLWELSRLSQQITIEGKKLQLKTVIAELNGKMELMGEPKAKRGYDKAVTKWEKTKIGLLGARAALRRVESWVDAMDQGNFNGEFRRYIWQPISDATTHYREMRRQTLEKYLELVKPIEGTITRDKISAPELGYTFGNDGSGRSELLGALLHTGNESNLQKLLRGRHWGEYREDGTLDTSRWDAFIQRMHSEGVLTKRDYDFVQSIWDLNESLKPDAQKAHKAMYGYYFEEITAQAFQTPFGEYKGGYMPAIVDPFIADDAALRTDKEALESQSNSFMFPTTGRGFTKSRKAGYAKPLMMDLRFIPSHLDKVLKFTYIEPHVKEIGRLVMNKEFRAGLADYVDTEVASQMLVPWLQRAARQTVETASMDRTWRLFDKFWKEVRSRTGLQIMTLNVTNALQQFTGLSIAAIKVKPSYLAPALGRYVRGPSEYASHISEKSEFMRNRVYSQSFEIQEKIDNILLDPTKLEKARDFAVKHGYFLQAGTQHVVDIITWGGAYDQAISEGSDEQVAVKMADSAVRETQGTFAAEDISRFETGSPFMRAFTMFYTYFNMQANMLGTEFGKAMKQGGFGGAGRGLYVYTMGFMIPAVLSELIVQAMSGKLTDDEDEDWADWLMMFFGGQERTITAMVPGVGMAVQSGINSLNDKWYDDRISTSPAVSLIESTARAAIVYPYKALTGEEITNEKRMIKDYMTAIGMATGLPAAALGRPLGYLADIEQGKAEPTGPIDFTRGMITGKAK